MAKVHKEEAQKKSDEGVQHMSDLHNLIQKSGVCLYIFMFFKW